MMGFFRDTSQFEKSIKACNDCIELMKKMGIEGTVDYATSLQNVANAYRAAGKLAESLEVYKEVFLYIMRIFQVMIIEWQVLTITLLFLFRR